jgi:hypothetical protein
MTDELYGIVEALGGRLNELELFVQKLKMNIPPKGRLFFDMSSDL